MGLSPLPSEESIKTGILSGHDVLISDGLALKVYRPLFGWPEFDSFWLDDLDCNGNDTDVIDCRHDPLGEHDYSTMYAAKLICNETGMKETAVMNYMYIN